MREHTGVCEKGPTGHIVWKQGEKWREWRVRACWRARKRWCLKHMHVEVLSDCSVKNRLKGAEHYFIVLRQHFLASSKSSKDCLSVVNSYQIFRQLLL